MGLQGPERGLRPLEPAPDKSRSPDPATPAPPPSPAEKRSAPMIDPNPPPSRMPRISASTSAVPLAGPPEKMITRRPLKADCTTWATRSARVDVGGAGLLVGGARLLLLHEVVGRLHLDDVGAELGGDLGGVRGDVEGGLALLAQVRAAGVGPDDDDEAVALGLLGRGPGASRTSAPAGPSRGRRCSRWRRSRGAGPPPRSR